MFLPRGSYFLLFAGVCTLLWDFFWGEWGSTERLELWRATNIWSLIRFHVSLLVLVSNTFCNYFIGTMLLSWKPFFRGFFLSGLGFFLFVLVFLQVIFHHK